MEFPDWVQVKEKHYNTAHSHQHWQRTLSVVQTLTNIVHPC